MTKPEWLADIRRSLGSSKGTPESRERFAEELVAHLSTGLALGTGRKMERKNARAIATRARAAIDAYGALEKELEAKRVGAAQLAVDLNARRLIALDLGGLYELERRALALVGEVMPHRPPGHLANTVAEVIAGWYWVHFGIPGLSRGDEGKHPTPYLRVCAAVEQGLKGLGRSITLGPNPQKHGRDFARRLENEHRKDGAATKEMIYRRALLKQ